MNFNQPNHVVNQNVTFDLTNFPSKDQLIAARKQKHVSDLLRLIHDKIMNSLPTVTTVTVSREELMSYSPDIYNEVFRELMVSKNFNIMKSERDATNFSYNISW